MSQFRISRRTTLLAGLAATVPAASVGARGLS